MNYSDIEKALKEVFPDATIRSIGGIAKTMITRKGQNRKLLVEAFSSGTGVLRVSANIFNQNTVIGGVSNFMIHDDETLKKFVQQLKDF